MFIRNILSGLITVVLFIGVSSCSTSEEAIGEGWVNGIETCPTHNEYGILVVDSINLYRSSEVNLRSIAGTIPHAAKVEILENLSADEMTKVRYEGETGHIQNLFLVDYDPANSVHPDESKCF